KVDPNRVYVWGIGEGARLALTAACAPGKPEFAAVGVVGQFDPEPGPTCQDRVPEGRAPEASWDRKVSETLWKFSSGHRLGA
ncbi:plasmid partitioning protein, partial [Frankia sp. KB5]